MSSDLTDPAGHRPAATRTERDEQRSVIDDGRPELWAHQLVPTAPGIVRRITIGDARLLEQVRLAALEEAPAAYASTLAAETNRPDAEWRQRASAGAAGSDSATFFAVLEDQVVGLAGGYRRAPSSTTVELVSMWVAPAARNRGVGTALVDAVRTWAVETNATTLCLWVARGNASAERLYASSGFIASGEAQPLPSDPCVDETRMVRSLP